jgi:hypothetical protein
MQLCAARGCHLRLSAQYVPKSKIASRMGPLASVLVQRFADPALG